jgi:hypothetical protein
MKLEIQTIANPGNVAKERIILRATVDMELGFYMILRSSASPDGLGATDGDQRAYWFPNQKLKKDDVVVLYSKTGANSVKKATNANTIYFYYWDLKAPICLLRLSAGA